MTHCWCDNIAPLWPCATCVFHMPSTQLQCVRSICKHEAESVGFDDDSWRCWKARHQQAQLLDAFQNNMQLVYTLHATCLQMCHGPLAPYMQTISEQRQNSALPLRTQRSSSGCWT